MIIFDWTREHCEVKVTKTFNKNNLSINSDTSIFYIKLRDDY